MNESQLLDHLKKEFNFSHGKGIGDDTSVVKQGQSYQLITKDILVDGIHFNLKDTSMEKLAAKSLAVNLSDIAAMGGEPQYYYLGLGFPLTFGLSKLFSFFNGLQQENKKWQVELAGGDFSKSPLLFVSITLIGRAENPIYRHQAKNHDLIGITGSVGDSAIGLALLKQGISHPYYIDKHQVVHPEIGPGKILARYVHAMIDISDGLLMDLRRILHSSAKGARINYEKIPISQQSKQICRQYALNEYETILAGGEDYRLLFTISKKAEQKLQHEKVQYYIIGEITKKQHKLEVFHHQKEIPVSHFGFDHFSS